MFVPLELISRGSVAEWLECCNWKLEALSSVVSPWLLAKFILESPEFKSLAMLEKIANWFTSYWLKFLTMCYMYVPCKFIFLIIPEKPHKGRE